MTPHLSRVTQALLKHPLSVVSRHIPLATHDVIDMLAHGWRVCRGFARAEAEDISGHKVLGAQSKDFIRTLWDSVRAIGKLPSTREFAPARRMHWRTRGCQWGCHYRLRHEGQVRHHHRQQEC